ncbi:MAG: hypothetical protein Q8Q13_00545 [bacterium]|nr:hypothetical protein [bacterium]
MNRQLLTRFAWLAIGGAVVTSLLLLQLIIPAISLADTAEPSAGFAPSIWMSRAQVVAGESVNIFTVLYNSSDNSLSGDVVFAVDGASIGTKNFTLGAGETQIVSAAWVAKSGNHTVSARIENAAGAGVNASLVNQTTGTISISVESPPPPSPTAQVLNTVTSAIQTGVASTAPAIAGVAGSLYGKTEALREQAKTALQKQLAENAPADASAKPKQTAGTPGSGPAEAGVSTAGADEGTPLVSKALRYMAAAGLAVVSSRTLFYISLALMLLILIKIVRAFLRERRRGGRHLPLD